MPVGLFLTLILAVAAAGLLITYVLGHRTSHKRKELSRDELREMKLQNQYDRRIRNGEMSRLLARVYSQIDMALILSILSSKNIVAKAEFGITNNMRNGIGIQGYNDIWLVVLNNDYDRAKEIMLDYVSRRKKINGNIPGRARLRNVFEGLLFKWAVNPDSRLPEMTAGNGSEYLSRLRLKRHRRNP